MYFHECFYVEKELLLYIDFPVITVNSFKFVDTNFRSLRKKNILVDM